MDFEPAAINAEIFKLNSLCFTKIKVGTPKRKNQLPACQNCQNDGHTKFYFNGRPRCVRCGDQHATDSCSKSRDLPAKCVSRHGDHPSNYRGCPVHKELQLRKIKLHQKLNKENSFKDELYVNSNYGEPNSTHDGTSDLKIKSNFTKISYAQAT